MPPAKIISTRTQSEFVIDWADKLDAIISRSTGFDHLLAYRDITKSNFPMGYLPLYCNRSVAEHAMMMWANLLRKFVEQMRQFKKFDRDGLTGYEMQGKTIVVYGVGNIGHEIVKIGKGLEMKVYGVDIDPRHADVEYISPQEGAKVADIIVCAMNLTDNNVDYFNPDFFMLTKPTSIFVNISRGEISRTTHLLDALESNRIAGVALDAFDHEKTLSVGLRSGMIGEDPQVLAIQKMMEMENVLLSPHNAFNTHESVERKSKQSIEQVIQFLDTQSFKWQV